MKLFEALVLFGLILRGQLQLRKEPCPTDVELLFSQEFLLVGSRLH